MKKCTKILLTQAFSCDIIEVAFEQKSYSKAKNKNYSQKITPHSTKKIKEPVFLAVTGSFIVYKNKIRPIEGVFFLKDLVELGDTASPSESSPGYYSTHIVPYFISAHFGRNKEQNYQQPQLLISN